MHRHTLGVWFVVMTAVLWAMTGPFSLQLERMGLAPVMIGTGRVTVAGVVAGFVLLFTMIRRRCTGGTGDWRITRSEFPLLLLNGLFGVSLFHFAYLTTIHEVGMGLGAILMYTKPAFVLFLAAYLIQEGISRLKIASLLLTLSGIMLVIDLPGLWQTGTLHVTVSGIMTGLTAGFAGALFATLNKVLMRRHPPIVINFYNLLFGAAGLWLLVLAGGILRWPVVVNGSEASLWTPFASETGLYVWMIAMGIITTFLPYIFYILGLQWIGAGQANIIAGIEPVVAMLAGVFVYAESLTTGQWLGGSLVVLAAVLISRPETSPRSVMSQKEEWPLLPSPEEHGEQAAGANRP